MTNAEYRAHEGISQSALKKMSESPEKFKYALDNPSPSTPAQIFGGAFHKLVLEPDGFKDEYAIIPEPPACDKRTTEGKAIYKEFVESQIWQEYIAIASERTCISIDDYSKLCAMRDKLLSVPYATKLLSGTPEVPFFWQDELTGEWCKGRADALTQVKDISIIVDLKTCANASTKAFMCDAVKYGYDLQAAMYKDGCDKTLDKDHVFIFIAIEKEPPYAVNIMQADNLMLDRGKMFFRKYMDMYAECKRTGNWWGYNNRDGSINNLTLPRWAMIESEE